MSSTTEVVGRSRTRRRHPAGTARGVVACGSIVAGLQMVASMATPAAVTAVPAAPVATPSVPTADTSSPPRTIVVIRRHVIIDPPTAAPRTTTVRTSTSRTQAPAPTAAPAPGPVTTTQGS